MPRRRFRYDPVLERMVEIADPAEVEAAYVQGDIEPFVSVVDGTLIKSRSHLRDYMGERNLVHYDPTNKAEVDRYASARQDTALREQLWENVDRMFATGRGPRS
jgi:hypothetical protein